MTTSEFTTVGKSVPREDGREKVTGSVEYTSDIELPGMLWGSFVRSPHAHATVEAIDASAAEQMDGVRCVLTQSDFPDRRFGEGVFDKTALADDRVLFDGHPVAVVTAESREVADRAARQVCVEYDERPAVVDGRSAFRADPPVVVHPELPEYETSDVLAPTTVDDRPNVYQHYEVSDGDVEAGFEIADHVYEDVYRTNPVDHVCLEPQVAVARPEPDGDLTIWSACQSVHHVEKAIARVLDRPTETLRVVEPYVGGSFGSKEAPLLEPIVGRLAEVTGEPVKLAHARAEEFRGGTVSGAFETTVKTGVTDDGDVVALEVEALCPGGAYASTGFMVARNATFAAVNSYSVPNVQVDAYGVYTNAPVSGSFRGFGNRQLTFPIESQLDDAARDLGVDPIAFRKQNLLEADEVTALNERRTDVTAGRCLDVAAEKLTEMSSKSPETSSKSKPPKTSSKSKSPEPSSKSPETPSKSAGSGGFAPDPADEDDEGEWSRGTGIALVNKHSLAPTSSSAIVRLNPDATAELWYSSDEIGQGNTTAVTQIVAEELAIPMADVDLVRADTSRTPYDAGSVSSRSVFNMGNAVKSACEDVKAELLDRTAHRLGASPSDLEVEDGQVRPSDEPAGGVPIEAALMLGDDSPEDGTEIVAKGAWHVEAGDPKPGSVGRVNAFYTEGVDVARVRVNKRTGEVEVEAVVAIFDVGTAIHPRLVEEQIRGAIGMGLGVTLFEELRIDESSGRLTNATLRDYHVPTVCDVTLDVESVVLESGAEDGPYGAKGIGEPPISGVSPAVGNAICNATGERVTEIPMTPERVFQSLRR